MKLTPFISSFLLLLLILPRLRAQDELFPEHIPLDSRKSYDHYEHYLIPSIDWLHQTPLGEEPQTRKRLDNFIMLWLQKNQDIVVTLPDYLIEFQNIHTEFYFLYAGAWIKLALQNPDLPRQEYFIRGVESMIEYYEKDMGIRENDFLNTLVEWKNHGRLRNLFDTLNYDQNIALKLITPSDRTEFGPDENFFHFRFTAINFTQYRALLTRYKMEGLYDDWIVNHDRSILFPKLPAGDYTLTIQASLFDDFRQSAEVSYSFSVQAPIWKRPWFLILVALSLLAWIYAYFRQREANLKRVAQLQQQRMIYEYDHLRNQINPHFLFNSLNTLTTLIEEEPKKAVKYSEHLSDLYRNILTYHSEDLVIVSEELNILKDYIHIQQSRFGPALQVEIDIDESTAQEKKIVPLALQLLLENAMKHNVVSKKTPLHIRIFAKDNYLVITNNIQPKLSKEKGVGLGLKTIRKRYAIATDRPVSFKVEDNLYVVRIPLL